MFSTCTTYLSINPSFFLRRQMLQQSSAKNLNGSHENHHLTSTKMESIRKRYEDDRNLTWNNIKNIKTTSWPEKKKQPRFCFQLLELSADSNNDFLGPCTQSETLVVYLRATDDEGKQL